MANTYKKYPWLALSPWAILGSLVLLAPIAFFLATSSINKDKENMTLLLVEKGAALIRSFEAGARTGMIGMGWGGVQVQRLLVETARQPDILYLVLTDESGIAVAHSDPVQIGNKHQTTIAKSSLKPSEGVRWHQVQMEKGGFAFEVYKRFTPIAAGKPGRGRMHHRNMIMSRRGLPKDSNLPPLGIGRSGQQDWCLPYLNRTEGETRPAHYIFVGLDMGALESAMVEARRHAIVMSAGVLLVAFAGMVSLFLAQGYKLTRRSLAKVRAFSDQLVDSLPMGLVASDEDGRVAAYNETAEAILRFPAHQVLGKTAERVLPPELWNLTERVVRGGTVIEEDLECETDRDRALPLRVSAAILYGEDDSFWGNVFIFRDLTEVRRLQQEVERSRRLAALGSLAAGVAHEIRNPLSSVKGFATYFKEKFKDDPQDQDTAKTMIQEVERLDRVIGQLLEFARPSTLKIKPVQVADIVQHSLKLVEGDARTKGIKIKSEVPSGLPDVLMDVDRMSQVLLNLYLNSIQAMDEGGTLEVKVSRDEGRKVTKIIVADNGQGIDPADLERIFDPYFTTKPGGTGLGLAIVHKIMEAHRGDMKVKSKPGTGTSMALLLPDTKKEDHHG